jgi:endonuclease YncB( thermonuclease family)
VRSSGKDRYGRVLGRVECKGMDANTEQVRRGMAWVYDRYVTDRSLYALQNEARAAHLGLWADTTPTAPWVWRAQHKR